MLAHRFLCNVNDTGALIGPCSVVTSRWCQIWNPCHVQPFTIAHIVIGLSLHIHSFLHLRRTIAERTLVWHKRQQNNSKKQRNKSKDEQKGTSLELIVYLILSTVPLNLPPLSTPLLTPPAQTSNWHPLFTLQPTPLPRLSAAPSTCPLYPPSPHPTCSDFQLAPSIHPSTHPSAQALCSPIYLPPLSTSLLRLWIGPLYLSLYPFFCSPPLLRLPTTPSIHPSDHSICSIFPLSTLLRLPATPSIHPSTHTPYFSPGGGGGGGHLGI